MNILQLDYVRDPDKLVGICLGKKDCKQMLSHAYCGWTVIFPTEERAKAAAELLTAMENRGLGHLVLQLLEDAERVREEWEAYLMGRKS
jgi:hypothetical protein